MIEYFHRGGPVMWPLLMCSLLSMAFFFERLWFWIWVWRRERPQDVSQVLQMVGAGRRPEALDLCSRGKEDYVLSMFHDGLRAGGPHTSLFVALDQSASDHYIHMKKFMPVFEAIVTLSPLLGIFGTVLGIVQAFDALGGHVENVQQVAAGVSQALITTVFGLIIAMPTLVFHIFFRSQVSRARHRMESALADMEIAIHEAEENEDEKARTP
ncbi:MotA/TolQ/ExbB proton channel family protein [bacterium]|nr:MotA/TolQ/ExbB proton channel family protein [bacterium]